jgi:DNA-binding transcriptional ArsR family regulator
MPVTLIIKDETKPPDPDLVRIALVFRALGNPLRLRLLQVLIQGQDWMDVSLAAIQAGVPIAYASEGMIDLEMAGLILRRREGKRVLQKTNVNDLNDFFTGIVAILNHVNKNPANAITQTPSQHGQSLLRP